MGRTFLDAPAQSTCDSPITAAQTTVQLASTSAFGAPSSILPVDLVILDSGNPAFDKNNPYATNFEYQPGTNNNTGTNTLTFNGGVRTGYAGTTPKSYFAGATVAAALLAEGLYLLPQRFATQAPSSGTTFSQPIPSLFRHLEIVWDMKVTATNTSLFIQINGDVLNDYYWTQNDAGSNGSRTGNGGEAVSSALVGFVGLGGSLTASGRIKLNDIQQVARNIRGNWEASYDSNATPAFHDLHGSLGWFPSPLAAITSVNFFLSGGGNFSSSNFDFIGQP